MATKVDKILKLAETVARLRAELVLAEEELRGLVGGRRARSGPAKKKKKKLSPLQQKILDALPPDFTHVKDIAHLAGETVARIRPRLSELKTMGYVVAGEEPKTFVRAEL